MLAKTHEEIFSHQNENFPSLLTSDIFAKQKRAERPRRYHKTDGSAHRISNIKIPNGGSRNYMHAITEV